MPVWGTGWNRTYKDEHLPDQIEAFAHQAGLTVQRRLFRVLIEKADQDLVLQHRHGNGGAAIQRRGTRPFTVTTIFDEVTVQRSRIRHNYDGTLEIPSATAWDTSHELTITQNLRDAVCDQRSDQSAGKSRTDVCQDAGDENLLGRSTVIDIVPQEGEQLIVAQRQRAARSWWPGCDTRSRKPRRRARGCKCRPCCCSWGFSAASGGCWSWATVPQGFEGGSRAWGFPSKR